MPESVTLAFQDDFESPSLANWESQPTWWVEGGRRRAGPEWSVESDGDDRVLSGVAEMGSPTFVRLLHGPFGDFGLDAAVRLVEGVANVHFRAYEEGERRGAYQVVLGPGAISLAKNRDGEYVELVSRPPGIGDSGWHTVSVIGRGESIVVNLDGEPVLSYVDGSDPILSGGVAFSVEGELHVDDIRVWLDTPSSDAVTWNPAGPMPAGGVWAVSVAPSDPDVVYVATRMNNAFRSEDGGRTWSSIAPLGAHIFAPIAVDPRDPDIIFASNGQVHRYDGGGRAAAQGAGWDESSFVLSIAIHEADPDIVYAADRNGTVFRTTDGGQEWEPVGTLSGEPTAGGLVVHPTNPRRLYAAVREGGIYRSVDGGRAWERTLSVHPPEQSLVMDPRHPRTLYVAEGTTIYRTRDGGGTWRRLVSSPPTVHLAVASSNPAVLYASGSAGLHRSDDGGKSWSATNYDEGAFGPPSDLVVSPSGEGLVYVGVEEGVVVSRDGGATWSLSNDGLVDRDAWQLAASPTDPERVYAGTFCMRGFFYTVDAGLTWSFVEGFHYVMDIAVTPSKPESIYMTHDSGLFASRDRGRTWDFVPDTLGYHLHGLAIDPSNPQVVYVGSTGGTGEYSAPYSTVYKTTDGGASWTEINEGLPAAAASVQAIAVDPVESDTVYVATYREGLSHTQGQGMGIFKSTDGGGTWFPVSQGLTTPNVNALVLDPFDPRRLYAGTDRGLFISTNGGELWVPLGDAPKVPINAVVPDPETEGTVYVTTESAGVFRTLDGGATWSSLNEGLPPLPTGDLVLVPSSGVIYVAVRGAGVFKTVVRSVP